MIGFQGSLVSVITEMGESWEPHPSHGNHARVGNHTRVMGTPPAELKTHTWVASKATERTVKVYLPLHMAYFSADSVAICNSTFDTADLPEEEIDDTSAPKHVGGSKHCAV